MRDLLASGKGTVLGKASLAVAFIAMVACGTRADHSPDGVSRAAPPSRETPAEAAVATPASVPGTAVQAAQGGPTSVSGPTAAKGQLLEPGSSTGGSRSEVGSTAGNHGQASAGSNVEPSPRVSSSTRPGSHTPGSPLGSQGPAAGVVQRGSPITMAHVGTLSGPAGTTLLPIVQGVQLWVKHVNEKGGLNGHAVQLIVYDDGGDPARHRAQVQDAVENKHAIGFLANTEALTGRSSINYLNEKQIPVVGVDGGTAWVYESPMYFPQQSSGEPSWFTWVAAVADQVTKRGKTKLGTLVCSEVQTCAGIEGAYAKYAKGLGLEAVYRGQASLAQPDFTAICIAARNAGVEILSVALDGNSLTRLAASCARQGYKPIYNTFSAVTLDRFKDDPNLDGFVAGVNVFPWFQSGTAATDEYQQAFRTWGAKLTPGQGLPNGWTAGKLLEQAAAHMPDPPTTAALLKGLWAIEKDDLGGLTPPLTYIEGQPAPKLACWQDVTIEGGRWRNHDDFTMHCRNWPIS